MRLLVYPRPLECEAGVLGRWASVISLLSSLVAFFPNFAFFGVFCRLYREPIVFECFEGLERHLRDHNHCQSSAFFRLPFGRVALISPQEASRFHGLHTTDRTAGERLKRMRRSTPEFSEVGGSAGGPSS